MNFSLKSSLSNQDYEALKSMPYLGDELGKLTYVRTYSRNKSNDKLETYNDIIERVTNGICNLMLEYFNNIPIDPVDFFKRCMEFKIMPPGRSLWAMGTNIIKNRKLFAALFNCGLTYFGNPKVDGAIGFAILMDMSMLGVGMGFRTDTKFDIQRPRDTPLPNNLNINAMTSGMFSQSTINGIPISEYQEFELYNTISNVYVIPDSREGWVQALQQLIDSYLFGREKIIFDYSQLREKGAILKTFGGISSGPEPLFWGLSTIRTILDKYINKTSDSRFIIDIMNIIGKVVVSGNIRRSSEIAFVSQDDQDGIQIKNYNLPENQYRMQFGWTSNNTVIIESNDANYDEIIENICVNGEPGLFWINNARNFGRMKDGPGNYDMLVMGTNPCGEQSLEEGELCNIIETYPDNHLTLYDYMESCKLVYYYSKCLTMMPMHWAVVSEVQARNKRIGISQSGIQEFIFHRGSKEYKIWCDTTYKMLRNLDAEFSAKMNISKSIKLTSIKPSGCISGDTVIKTNKGPISIKDIVKLEPTIWPCGYGEMFADTNDICVYDKDDNEIPILGVYANSNNEDIYEIEYMLNGKSHVLKCTKNHQILVDNELMTPVEILKKLN